MGLDHICAIRNLWYSLPSLYCIVFVHQLLSTLYAFFFSRSVCIYTSRWKKTLKFWIWTRTLKCQRVLRGGGGSFALEDEGGLRCRREPHAWLNKRRRPRKNTKVKGLSNKLGCIGSRQRWSSLIDTPYAVVNHI